MVRDRGPGIDLSVRRATTSAAILADFADELGIDIAEVLCDTGIGGAILRDVNAEITAGQELQLVRNLVDSAGDRPGLGVEAGLRYRLSKHGVLGYAMLTSRTLREAIEVGAAYFALSFSYAHFGYRIVGSDLRIWWDDTSTPQEVRGFLLERDATAMLGIWAELFDDVLPVRRVEVAEPMIGRLRPVFDFVDAAIVPSRRVHTVTLDAGILDRPLPQANPQAAHLLEQQCAALLERRTHHGGVAARVGDELVRRRGALATQEAIAESLGMSVRTLRRRLTAEGTSFRELSAETLGMLAEEWLAAGFTVESVASRLGYRDPSTFASAFKRWKGESPGRFARRCRL